MELLVAIALFSILVTIGVGGFAKALRTQREVAGLLAAESNASVALEQIAREIRTGDLFCHAPDQTTPSPTCACAPPAQSAYLDPGAPVAVADPTLLGHLPVWSCDALEYVNAAGDTVNYSLQNGALIRTVNGVPQGITGDNVSVRHLAFTLFGNTEGDNWTPRITVEAGVSASSTDPVLQGSVLDIQTTVSARSIDCTQTGITQC